MLGLVGPRGVGKTTLFLQRIKRQKDPASCLFVSADDIYFADRTLIDTAERFHQQFTIELAQVVNRALEVHIPQFA